jgi:predicted permease
MVNHLLLRPLPGITDPDGAAFLRFTSAERPNLGVSGPVAEELRHSATLLDGLATYDHIGVHASVGGSRAMAMRGYTVYGDYFELLGVRPLIGRLLTAAETGPDADASRVVISERVWLNLFGGALDVVGRQVLANDHALTVVGVVSGAFQGTDRGVAVDFWVPRSAFVPLARYPRDRLWSPRSTLNQDFVVRPRPGVSFEAAESQVNQLLARISGTSVDYPQSMRNIRATLYPGLNVSPEMRRVIYPVLRILAGAALLALLIPCANVVSLMLVRGMDRRAEDAVRRALGASAGRIAWEQVFESLMLAAAGTAMGLGLAWLIGMVLRGDSLGGLPVFEVLDFDVRVLGFTVVSILLTTGVIGLLPGLLTARIAPGSALRDASRNTVGGRSAFRRGLCVFQLGLSLTLLIGGILLTRTVRNLYAVDTGASLNGVTALTVDFGLNRVEKPALDALHRELLGAVQMVPGIEAAALHSWYGPYMGRLHGQISRIDRPDVEAEVADMHWVSPTWFELLGIGALSGRTFRAPDWDASLPRVVLTAHLARRLYGRIDVIGTRVRIGTHTPKEAEIVGVVGDLRLNELQALPDAAFFVSSPSIVALTNPVTIIARSDGAATTANAMRMAVEAVVPALPVSQPERLTTRLDTQLSEQRLLARLLALLSLLVTPVAAVGLYSVIAYSVAQRKREFAVRMALGAKDSAIVRLVARSAATILVLGLGFGLVGAYALSRTIQSRLFGVEAVDTVSWFAAAVSLAIVAVLASAAPVRVALKADPTAMLRSE